MSESLLKLVGARIRDLRKEKGLSQEQLGQKAGFHFSYIGGIERAEKNISLLNLSKIADALEVNVSELFAYLHTQEHTSTEKEAELKEIFAVLIEQDVKGLRKAKAILNELFDR